MEGTKPRGWSLVLAVCEYGARCWSCGLAALFWMLKSRGNIGVLFSLSLIKRRWHWLTAIYVAKRPPMRGKVTSAFHPMKAPVHNPGARGPCPILSLGARLHYIDVGVCEGSRDAAAVCVT